MALVLVCACHKWLLFQTSNWLVDREKNLNTFLFFNPHPGVLYSEGHVLTEPIISLAPKKPNKRITKSPPMCGPGTSQYSEDKKKIKIISLTSKTSASSLIRMRSVCLLVKMCSRRVVHKPPLLRNSCHRGPLTHNTHASEKGGRWLGETGKCEKEWGGESMCERDGGWGERDKEKDRQSERECMSIKERAQTTSRQSFPKPPPPRIFLSHLIYKLWSSMRCCWTSAVTVCGIMREL